MKKLNKIILLTLLLLLSLSINVIVKADTLNGPNLAGYEEVSTSEVTTLSGGVKILSKRINTIHNGVGPNINHHTVNYAIGNMNDGIKVVAAGSFSDHGWTAITTRQAMIEYEKHNPGYICIAGINADGFDIKSTQQPYRHFMTDGDLIRPEGGGYLLGFNDTTEIIHGYTTTISDNIYLKKYTEDKTRIESETAIAVVNNEPSKTGINLYTTGNDVPVDLTGYKVYDCLYEMSRVAFDKTHVFVKGTVDTVIDGTTNMTPKLRHFYLASLDGSLDDVIKTSDYIKCEYNLMDGYKRAKNIIGVTHQLMDGDKILYKGSEKPFENINHPRSIIGLRKNGDMILTTIDGRGDSNKYLDGASFFECGQILKAMGCYQGYTFDGGGSTTLVARMSSGEFKVLNTPSDGSERSCGNHLLFVMKDPGFTAKAVSTTYNSINVALNVKAEDEFKKIKNIKFNFNGQDYPLKKEGVLIDGLTANTKYQGTISYDEFDEGLNKTINKIMKLEFQTKEFKLEEEPFKMDINGSFITFTDKELENVTNIILKINDIEFNLSENKTYRVTDLLKNKIYKIEYRYTLNDKNNTKDITEVTEVKTKIFNSPYDLIISEVKKDVKNHELELNVKFNDIDGVVCGVKLYLNDNWYTDLNYEIGNNSINTIINDIDYQNNENKIKVIVEYRNNRGKVETLESNELTLAIESNNKNMNTFIIIISVIVGITAISLITLGIVLRKKRKI